MHSIDGDSPNEINVLDQLAQRIRAALQVAADNQRNALRAALDAGEALIAARERVTTGWKRWLQDGCGLRPRTAELYAQLAAHRTTIEARMGEIGGLMSVRAARQLISKPAISNKRAKMNADLATALRRATDQELTAALAEIGLVRFLRLVPPAWRSQFEEYIADLRASKGDPANKLSLLVRKAFSLVQAANEPGSSATVANENEALAAIRRAVVLLRSTGFDLNDILVHATKTASKKGARRAA
jgi:hypothetical protein